MKIKTLYGTKNRVNNILFIKCQISRVLESCVKDKYPFMEETIYLVFQLSKLVERHRTKVKSIYLVNLILWNHWNLRKVTCWGCLLNLFTNKFSSITNYETPSFSIIYTRWTKIDSNKVLKNLLPSELKWSHGVFFTTEVVEPYYIA